MAHLLQSLLKMRTRTFGARPRVVRRLGKLWLIDPNDLLDLRVWAYRDIEPEARAALTDLAERIQPTMFFDIGANAGAYSLTIAETAPSVTQIHAFEPAKSTHARLTANIWLNKRTDKIEAHRMALADREGEAEFYAPTGVSGGASLARNVADKGAGLTVEKVRLSPFDALFALEGETLLFKIDVETAEEAVLNGMEKTLRANRCALQIELWPNHAERAIAQLAGFGYRRIGNIDRDVYFSNIEGVTISSA